MKVDQWRTIILHNWPKIAFSGHLPSNLPALEAAGFKMVHLTITKLRLMSKGIRDMMIAVVCFALMNLCIKLLPKIPSMEIVFFRCLIAMVLSMYFLRHIKTSWWGVNRLFLALRGIFGTMALYFFFVSVKNIPFASAVTLAYTSPVFTTLFASWFLKERVGWQQWSFFGLSLLGVILLKGLDTRIPVLYFVYGLLSAIFSGLAYIMVRSMKDTEHPQVVVFHFQIIGTVAGLALSAGNMVVPVGFDWIYVVLVGILAFIGQLYLTYALQGEKIGIVSSLNFSGVIFAALFGWLLFNEHLTAGNILAIVLVATGVIGNIMVGRKSLRKTETTLIS